MRQGAHSHGVMCPGGQLALSGNGTFRPRCVFLVALASKGAQCHLTRVIPDGKRKVLACLQ